uniref:Methyltransferase type 11 domain-containing protein n=1 Tax=Ditylum brightwellii TaxID=49249 RepID=A0A7S2EAN7_9STRA
MKLICTAAALIYGQRMVPKSFKWTKRMIFSITALMSFALSAVGILLLVLNNNQDLRSRSFANFCAKQGFQTKPIDEFRCSILEKGNVAGKVLEFGPGPGTNFKCFQNSTAASAIQEYVAVEPNAHFQQLLNAEKKKRNLDFPLEFVGIKGEDVDISEEGSFDVVIATHVLCSVESPEVVLANVDRALKPGGTFIFFEHVIAEPQTNMRYLQNLMAPILYIVGNGCRFLETEKILRRQFADRFEIDVTPFYAPVPSFLTFIKPHIMGIAIKN